MNKKTRMISHRYQATFLLSNAFLLVNFGEAIDKGDSQYVGDENGCHGLEEGQLFRRRVPWARFLGLAIGIGVWGCSFALRGSRCLA
jgi:hypothetical protein